MSWALVNWVALVHNVAQARFAVVVLIWIDVVLVDHVVPTGSLRRLKKGVLAPLVAVMRVVVVRREIVVLFILIRRLDSVVSIWPTLPCVKAWVFIHELIKITSLSEVTRARRPRLATRVSHLRVVAKAWS